MYNSLKKVIDTVFEPAEDKMGFVIGRVYSSFVESLPHNVYNNKFADNYGDDECDFADTCYENIVNGETRYKLVRDIRNEVYHYNNITHYPCNDTYMENVRPTITLPTEIIINISQFDPLLPLRFGATCKTLHGRIDEMVKPHLKKYCLDAKQYRYTYAPISSHIYRVFYSLQEQPTWRASLTASYVESLREFASAYNFELPPAQGYGVTWYHIHGIRPGKPAIAYDNGTQIWGYIDKSGLRIHRIDGPAIIGQGIKIWCSHGMKTPASSVVELACGTTLGMREFVLRDEYRKFIKELGLPRDELRFNLEMFRQTKCYMEASIEYQQIWDCC